MNGLAAPRQTDVDQATPLFSRVEGGPSRPRATDVKLGGTADILLNILTSRPARALAAHDDR